VFKGVKKILQDEQKGGRGDLEMMFMFMSYAHHISTINNSVEVDPGEVNSPSFSGEIKHLL